MTNRKSPERRGKVQLVDARELWQKMRKSLGDKRKELSTEHIAEVTRLYGAFEEGERVKILPNEAFGFLRITVERPLRLRWEITDDTLTASDPRRSWPKLHPDVVDTIVAALAVSGGDLCRVHVPPSSFPVEAKVVERKGQMETKIAFYVRIGNGTREVTDQAERQKYIASRWGSDAPGGHGSS